MTLNPELLPSKEIVSWAGKNLSENKQNKRQTLNQFLIGSIPPAGALCGSLIAGPLMHYIGRKYTVMITSPIWILAWSIIASSHHWHYLVIGRFMSGMGVGLTLPSAQIYVKLFLKLKLKFITVFLMLVFRCPNVLIPKSVELSDRFRLFLCPQVFFARIF